jgi:hypothetical protein
MDDFIDKIVEHLPLVLALIVPAALVALAGFKYMDRFIKNEENRRMFVLHKDLQKQALPLRLQAYERLALLLERIKPNQLLLRISPKGTDKFIYERALVQAITDEFEHNITQQIYITKETWNVILTAKNTTIRIIRNASHNEEVADTQKMREYILTQLLEKETPSDVALDYIKKEVRKVFK